MSLQKIDAGENAPECVNVVIEIPMHSDPVKYEVDKETGALHVDRILSTSMHYPANYGYVPHTLAEDGDPTDILVLTPIPLIHGCVIEACPIGMLDMEDEAGQDTKLIAVPKAKLCPMYAHVESVHDLPEILLESISHFFEHYKDLEKNKWVKVTGWQDREAALVALQADLESYAKGA